VPELPLYLRIVRQLLKNLNYRSAADRSYTGPEPFDLEKLRAAEIALRNLAALNEGGGDYLGKHIGRLARTLALVPPPATTSRVLELGCYMQITPLLNQLCGYREVRGAYYGPKGRIDRRVSGAFECDIDHFDAERDPFPYPNNHFDLVVAGEILEHMIYDPMHLLTESNRVLAEGGRILVTTPNIASLASLAKTLGGRDNPQIFPYYKLPDAECEIGHMREYTAYELGEAVKAAGFEIEQLFTTVIAEYLGHWPLLKLLAENGYSTENRGEQSWCLGVKKSALPINRYPSFIYNS
jgi:SAM-dependent methyltransferase